MITHEEIDRRFTFVPPNKERLEKHKIITAICLDIAHELVDILPPGREMSLAITALEEVRMRANQAIATNTTQEESA